MFPLKFTNYPTKIVMALDDATGGAPIFPSSISMTVGIVKDTVTLYAVTAFNLFTDLSIADLVVTGSSKTITSATGFTGLVAGDKLTFWSNTQLVVEIEEVVDANTLTLTREVAYSGTPTALYKINTLDIDATLLGIDLEEGKYEVTVVTSYSANPIYTDTFDVFYNPTDLDCVYAKIIDTLDICTECISNSDIKNILKALEAWGNMQALEYVKELDDVTRYEELVTWLTNYCDDTYCNPC